MAGVIAIVGAAWQFPPSWAGTERTAHVQATGNLSADELQRQILRDDLGKPSDPQLAKRFAEINARHFSGGLVMIPVIWEPRLEEVGQRAGRSFTLLGVFGQSGDKSMILLHPSLKDDPAALDRALSHEMVHAYLYSVGDTSPDHGEAFRAVLHRLVNEGAFASIEATPEERAQLRDWLATEQQRMDAERKELEALGPDLDKERLSLEATVSEFNARVAAANQSRSGWPSAEESAAINASRDAYNQRAAGMNRRGLELRLAQDEYNRQAARYNLMASYPDGLDEPVAMAKVRR